MSAIGAWVATVFLAVLGVLVLHHLGLNMSAFIGGSLHSIEHALGQPL